MADEEDRDYEVAVLREALESIQIPMSNGYYMDEKDMRKIARAALAQTAVMEYKLCRYCGQPMKPKGVKKLPDQYDHAQGCPYSRKTAPNMLSRVEDALYGKNVPIA